ANLQYQVAQAQLQQAGRAIDRGKMQQLEAQLSAARKTVVANQQKVDDLQKKLDDANNRLDRVQRQYQFAKANYDHDRYDFESSRANKESSAEIGRASCRERVENGGGGGEVKRGEVGAQTTVQ